jgi:multiple sugar transport system substrate-binding protein
LAAVPVLVLSACGGSSSTTAPAATPTVGPTATVAVDTSVPTETATANNAPVKVRWFIGLGAGSQPSQIDAEKAFVKDFNTKNPTIILTADIVPNTNAYDILKTQIAAGNPPDIIGPVGVRGRNGFEGMFLDLSAEITKNNFDLTQYDPALVKFFQSADGQVGLPYDIFPAFMFYNKDLFKAAGLPNLPTKVGDQYQGKTWNWDNLTTIAQQLTLDESNKKSTDAGFNPDKIKQFGIDFQWWDGRRMASAFGAGSFVGPDGNAQIPQTFQDAWTWYYSAMWTKHFAPTGKYVSSTMLNAGTTVSSGRIAMDATNGWAISSFGSAGKATFKAWDMAVMPANAAGVTTGPMDSDTFCISKGSKVPDQAFTAMVAMLADPGLMLDYGGEPAKTADQAAYFKSFDTQLAAVFPGNQVTWSVLAEMAKYPAVPSHEADMPAFLASTADYSTFYTKLQNTKGLDVAAEMAALTKTLQKEFDSVKISNL